jgi:iron complex outermembrane receptor protein
MIELFGDRGYLLGDTRLRPERAETFDLGLALRGRHGDLRGRAELRGFVTLASDLIRYRRTAQLTAVPENVASATLFGGELGVSGAVGRHFALAGALTLLDTRTDYLGAARRLPLRPWLTAYLRPAVSTFDLGPLARVDLWADLAFVSESYLFPANDPGGLLAPRTKVGVGVSLHIEGGLRVDLAVRDLLDQRGADLLGFPLPGRTFTAALTLAPEDR